MIDQIHPSNAPQGSPLKPLYPPLQPAYPPLPSHEKPPNLMQLIIPPPVATYGYPRSEYVKVSAKEVSVAVKRKAACRILYLRAYNFQLSVGHAMTVHPCT
jgi:hypothetical protein